MRRSVRPPLHAYDVLCFSAMALVGMGVVLEIGFMQRSDMMGLGDLAGRLVLVSVLTALAAPGAVLVRNLFEKVTPLVFFLALAAGAALYLGEAITLRLMLPSALT